jgi:branched-chain amino acid transport system ATP-binding protein
VVGPERRRQDDPAAGAVPAQHLERRRRVRRQAAAEEGVRRRHGGPRAHARAPAAVPGLTIRDNLELGARRLRKQPNTRDEDLERVYSLFPKLKERSGQTAGTLSGGEQQQCAIGRSLMGRPTLLLLDEPTLGLSVGVKEAIIGSIQSIKDTGTTMLLVEQDVNFAFRCADRVVVLEHGLVAREGPTAQIAADPYVKQAYLGVA